MPLLLLPLLHRLTSAVAVEVALSPDGGHTLTV